MILGRAGTGKTTLARRLGEISGTPVIVLDSLWSPGWTQADVPEFRALVQQTHAGPAWISDGNFAIASFDLRLPGATLILWLDRPTLLCTWRAIARVFKSGEPHRLVALAKVLRFIWRFDRVNRPRIEAARVKHGPDIPVLNLNSDRETERFFAQYEYDRRRAHTE